MKIQAKFVFEYPDEETAKNLKDSLEVDNDLFVRTTLTGATLTAELEAENVMSLLHTTEDFLACLVTAESMLKQAVGKE